MNPWAAWFAALVGCLLLAWLCAEVHIEAIEDDLVSRTETSLQNLKIENLHVFASGRDIVLEGVAPTEGARQTAYVKAEAVEGVFTVTNRLRVAKAGRPAAVPADPAVACCDLAKPEQEKPGPIKGDRALPSKPSAGLN